MDKGKLTLSSFVILIVVGLYITFLRVSTNEDNWNNGFCSKDGTKWTYSSSAYQNRVKHDYYTCENGHVIDIIGW